MAEDNAGRDVGSISPQELAKGMLGAVTKVQEFHDAKSNETLVLILEAARDISRITGKKLTDEVVELKKYVAEILDLHKKRLEKKDKESTITKSKSFKVMTQDVRQMRTYASDMRKMAKNGDFVVSIANGSLKALGNSFKEASTIRSATRSLKSRVQEKTLNEKVARRSGNVERPQDQISDADVARMNEVAAATNRFRDNMATGLKLMGVMASKVSMIFDINISDIWSGTLKTANNFRENLREILQQTQGFVELNRDVEESYHDITSAARASGQKMEVYMEKYLENLRKGYGVITDSDKAIIKASKEFKKFGNMESQVNALRAKRAKSVTTTALHTASQLSMDAGELNDIFYSWHQHLGLSSVEIGNMSSHMQEVARQTGISGTKLQQAVMSAADLAKKLRSSGHFTAAAGRNVTELVANFEKFGVGPEGRKLLEAMSSRHSFLEADPITRGYMERVARETGNPEVQDRMRGGTLLFSKTASTQFYGGMEKDLKRMIGHWGPEIESIFKKSGRKLDLATMSLEDIPDIFKVLEEQGEHQLYGMIGDLVKRQTGMDVGDIQRIALAGKETSKTTGEKIQGLADKEKGFEDGSALQKRAHAELLEAQSAERDYGLTEWHNIMKEAKKTGMSIEDAQKNLTKRLGDQMGPDRAAEFAANIAKESQKHLSVLSERATAQGKDLGTLTQEAGGMSPDQIAKALAGTDPLEIEKAQMVMQEAMQRLAVSEKASSDPISEIRNDVRELRIGLTGGFMGVLRGINETLVSILAWGATLFAPMLAAILVVSKGFGFLTGMLKMGGAAARGGVAVAGAGAKAVGAGGSWLGKKFGQLTEKFRGTKAGGKIAEWTGKVGSKLGGGVVGKVLGKVGGVAGKVLGKVGGVAGKVLGPLAGAAASTVAGGMPVYVTNFHEMGMMGMGGSGVPSFLEDMATGGAKNSPVAEVGKEVAKKGLLSRMWGGTKNLVGKGVGGTKNLLGGLLGKGGSLLGKGGSLLGKGGSLLGKAAGPLGLLFGAGSGFFGAEEAGRNKVTGTALGALTGGADTGSMFSGLLGAKKGGAADDTIGIGGAAAYGAATGAAIGSIIPGLGTAVGALAGGIIGSGTEVIKIITDENSALGKMIRGTFTDLWTGTKEVFEGGMILFGEAWDGIKGVAASASEAIGGAINTALDWTSSALDGIKGFFGSFAEGISSAFTGVVDSLKGFASGFMDTVSGIAGGIVDGAKGIVSGIGNAASAVASGVGSAVSNVVDGVAGVASSAAGAVASGAGAVWDGGVAAASAVGDFVNPFNWFDKGTLGIQKDGLAYVHAGEMIVPKGMSLADGPKGFNQADALRAGFTSKNDGGKQTAGGVNRGLFDYSNPMQAITAGFGNVMDKSGLGGIADAVGTSLKYAKDMGSNAIDKGKEIASTAYDKVNSMLGLTDRAKGAYQSKENGHDCCCEAIEKGLFEKQDINDVKLTTSSIESIFKKAGDDSYSKILKSGELGKKLSESLASKNNKNGSLDAGRGTYYSTYRSNVTSSAMDAYNMRQEESQRATSDTSKSLYYLDEYQKAAMSAQPMDYTDQMKGQMSVNAMRYEDAEGIVAKSVYGDSPEGAGGIVGMDVISDYLLTTNTELLTSIRDILGRIEGNTKPGNSPNIVNAAVGTKYQGRPGVRRQARDTTTGKWNFDYGDMSPGSVTSDGRGGSA